MTDPTLEAIRARLHGHDVVLWHLHAHRDITWLLERDRQRELRIAELERLVLHAGDVAEAASKRIAELEAAAKLPTLDLSTLTPREREVVDLLASGVRLSAIAVRLGLSRHTVRNVLKNAAKKLGVHSQLELVARMGGR